MYSTLYSVCTLSQKHKKKEYSDEIMHRMGGVLIMQFEARSVHKVRSFNEKTSGVRCHQEFVSWKLIL